MVFKCFRCLCHRENADIQSIWTISTMFACVSLSFYPKIVKLHQFCWAKCALSEKGMRTKRGMVSICWCALSESALSEVRTKRGIAVNGYILDVNGYILDVNGYIFVVVLFGFWWSKIDLDIKSLEVNNPSKHLFFIVAILQFCILAVSN